MTLKDATANSLLAFVAATCVVLIVRAVDRPQPAAPVPTDVAARASPQQAPVGPSSVPAMPDGVHVYYLHGNIRCPTVRTSEAYAKEAVETGFASELQSGKVTFRVVNYDRPENRHYQSDYQVVAPTVVLAKWRDGKQVDWRNLNEVWEYVNDKPGFLSLVQNHLREILGQPTLAAAPARSSGSPARQPASRVLPVPEPLGLDLRPPATAGSGGSDAPQPPMPGELPGPPANP